MFACFHFLGKYTVEDSIVYIQEPKYEAIRELLDYNPWYAVIPRSGVFLSFKHGCNVIFGEGPKEVVVLARLIRVILNRLKMWFESFYRCSYFIEVFLVEVGFVGYAAYFFLYCG